jgi:hypothetical protein
VVSEIKKARQLGNSIIDGKFTEDNFSNYQNIIIGIVKRKLQTELDDVQLKACQLILNAKVKDFHFGFFRHLIASYHETGRWITNNSRKQLCERYILYTNSMLSTLN